MTDWDLMLRAIASATPTQSAYDVCRTLTLRDVGAMLFTVMSYNPVTQRSRRTFSDNHQAYPLSGEKPLSVGIWSQTVVDRREPFIANTIEDIAIVFPDHPLIKSLGLGSVLNVPIIAGDGVRATINILHETGYFTPERVQKALALTPFYAAATLAAIAVGEPLP